MSPVSSRASHGLDGGLRTRGRSRRPNGRAPLVTVVTIVFNGADYVEKTLQSVAEQTFPWLEFVVVDGGSSDGTVDVIRRYDDRIDYWISEPDRGIYDAMNKGARLGTGEWICFMNAGDTFLDHRTVERVFHDYPDGAELIYGDCQVDYGHVHRTLGARKLGELWKGMVFSHQSLFARRSLLCTSPFDADHGVVADFAFVWKMFNEGRVFHYVPGVVAIVDAHGVSDANRAQTLERTYRAVRQHRRGPIVSLYFLHRVLLELLKTVAKAMLPRPVVRLIQRHQPR